MRSILTLIFLLILSVSFSQEVVIKGVALDSLKGKNRIFVTINDTLRKFEAADRDCYPMGTWNKINKKYRVQTEYKTGYFEIKADLSDSLTFSSSFTFRHIPQTYAVKDLYERDEVSIELEPEKCIEYVECKDESTVYAFVGEVLELKKVEEIYYCNSLTLDNKYQAKLKINHQVYNDYKKDTITFFAYDHYGKPAFSKFENVLIYVSEACDVNYHAKYLFSPAHKVGDSWYVTYGTPQTEIGEMLHKRAKPVDFDDEVYFILDGKTTVEELKDRYPEPYFSIEGDLLRPLYGYDVKDFFEVMKETRLKKYGFFQDE